MTQNPKYSIIIPTRNGANYISAPIKTVLSEVFSDFELIISVNHSEDNTLQLINEFSDVRLRVIRPPQLLSMAGHYEWCLRHAKGDWVTIIGDDDGVMPFFFDQAEALLERWRNTEVEAFSFRRAYYFWPGCEEVYGKSVLNFTAQRYEYVVKPKAVLLRAGAFDLEHFDLPQIYTNNLVKRSLINRIRLASGGKFYHELNPDVYSGVAIAMHAKAWVRSEWPLFWTGTSPKSVGLSTSLENSSGNADSGISRLTYQDGHSTRHSRSNEFFRLSSADGVGVAPEIGLQAWKRLGSSHLWVVSALLVYEKILRLPQRFKRPLILGACVRALQSKRKISKSEGEFLIKDILVRNKINRPLFLMLRIIFKLIPILKFINRIHLLVRSAIERKGALRVVSHSHVDYPDLMAAHNAVRMVLRQDHC